MGQGLLKYSETEGLNVQLGQGGYIYRAPTTLVAYSDDTYVAITVLGADDDVAAQISLVPIDLSLIHI